MDNMLKRAIIAAIAASIAFRLYTSLSNYGIHREDHYRHEPGRCFHIEGFDDGSEDMVQLPGGIVITTHGLGYCGMGKKQDYANDVSAISIFDLNKPEEGARKLEIVKTNGVDFDSVNMQPHGIGHYNDGTLDYFFIVNHGHGHSIEKFLYKDGKLQHLKTYRHELFYGLNDVAPFGPDAFYTTNALYFHHSILKYIEVFFSIPLASTVLYEDGKARVVANAVLMNGINFSREKTHLYISEHSPSAGFGIYKRLPNNDIKLVKHQHIGRGVDNVEVLANGNIVLGTHISAIKAMMKLIDRKNVHCPSEVLYIKMKDPETLVNVRSLYADDGVRVNCASVATVKSGHLLIGTFHEKMTYCDLDLPY